MKASNLPGRGLRKTTSLTLGIVFSRLCFCRIRVKSVFSNRLLRGTGLDQTSVVAKIRHGGDNKCLYNGPALPGDSLDLGSEDKPRAKEALATRPVGVSSSGARWIAIGVRARARGKCWSRCLERLRSDDAASSMAPIMVIGPTQVRQHPRQQTGILPLSAWVVNVNTSAFSPFPLGTHGLRRRGETLPPPKPSAIRVKRLPSSTSMSRPVTCSMLLFMGVAITVDSRRRMARLC